MNHADLTEFLSPTRVIDRDHPEVRRAAEACRREQPADTAIALFEHVRDRIRYTPFPPFEEDAFIASGVLARGEGYCVQKAVLLAALGRAAGIPSRLGFADVRNHKVSDTLREAMGTNLFVYHGYTEFHLGGAWVKATPAFDAHTSEKLGVLPVDLDGIGDALFHPVDPRGNPFIEYVTDHGGFADLPFERIMTAILTTYGPDAHPDAAR
jgi:transglutaminase-like putative cysteine protease